MAAVDVFDVESRLLRDFSDSRFPSQLTGLAGEGTELCDGATHFGYVAEGDLELVRAGHRFHLSSGMYFSAPGITTLSGDASGFVASRLGFRGLMQIGGPIESGGRLKYIDGCSDTLLIGPPVLGDPCLNLLHIPPFTEQTSHTHPSERLGMIAAGHGICKTPESDIPLRPGTIFAIEADGVHSFHTLEESLLVIAWHPDSDCGPRHDDHPMINRTMIDGVSAAKLNSAPAKGVAR